MSPRNSMTAAADVTRAGGVKSVDPPSAKPRATLSVDLDNAWAYRRAAGHDDWQQTESFLPLAVDRMVTMLKPLGLPLSVFLVGRDLDDRENVKAIERFRDLRRCEFANHSWNHLPWLHTMSPEQIEGEIGDTSDAIEHHFGVRPVGFRGPGFSCPPRVLRVLKSHQFRYDASMFPTSLAPLARAVFLLRSNLKGEQREKAKKLYGGFGSAFLPNRPHRRVVDGYASGGRNETLHEIPVTTLPFLRTPIHLTYIAFLAEKSPLAAKAYFATAMRLCRWTGVSPSLLLHPPDFLGSEDAPLLAGFPGLNRSWNEKSGMIRWILQCLSENFDVRTLAETVPDDGDGFPSESTPVDATASDGVNVREGSSAMREEFRESTPLSANASHSSKQSVVQEVQRS